MTAKRLTVRSAIAAILLTGAMVAAPAPAQAGDSEMALLSSYIGEWAGESVLQGGDAPEPFRCRLKVSKGVQAKINYSGRCALVNSNLSVAGTIAFDDASGRYMAAMSSNVGFTGQAVGFKSGNQINFDLATQQIDRGGNQVRIGAKIQLIADTISVDFEVEFNNSGQVLTADVPFAR
jgi:hypothetical protein